jgi:methylated-DNA-[protein]-cysteine S-methyltransferase
MKKKNQTGKRIDRMDATTKQKTCEVEFICHYDSPLGGITLTADGSALTGLWFSRQTHFADMLAPAHEEKPLSVFDEAKHWLDVYFSGKEPGFTPPLNMKGSPFRRAVWEILLTIPFGKTMTYGEIARILAEKNGVRRMSAQAVGGAVGHNPVSLIIPCHRVIGANGNLTGYGGGLERKVRLLELEGVDMTPLFLPK